jgi:calcineurin-like phosphoesterase family protein
MIWFTADCHFGHASIIESCKRPWSNVDKMDSDLIRLWNESVKPEDTIYIVGDFCIKTAKHRSYYELILNKLNGKKILIPGNHEIEKYSFYCGDRGIGFWSLHYPYVEVDDYLVCHDPALATMDRDSWFLCGHVHDQYHICGNVINVGVDVNDYRPISLNDIHMLSNINKIKIEDTRKKKGSV